MRKRWFERPPRQGEVGVSVTVTAMPPDATEAFLERLRNLPPPDPEVEILVPVIIYPINGRADCVNPVAHWYWASDRGRAIADVMEEVRESEGHEDLVRFAELLETHDLVRIGRIVVSMLRLKQSVVQLPGPPWQKSGVEVLD